MNPRLFLLLGALAALPPPSSALTLSPGRVEVVLSPAAEKGRFTTAFAAREMTNFLSRALGTPVPLVHRPDLSRVSIVLGTNTWSAAAGVDISALPRDAALLRTTPKGVFIAGADGAGFRPELRGHLSLERGTLHGVYEFLERYVGCRFYFPGELGEVVPRHDRLEIPEGDLVTKPDYTVRHSTSSLGVWPEEYGRTPPGNLFHLRLRYQTKGIPCCHGQCRAGFCRRFGKTHPEYFRLTEKGTRHVCASEKVDRPDSWQHSSMCNSSGIWDEIYEDAKSYFRGEGPEVRGVLVQRGEKGFRWGPQAAYGEYYDIMPDDGMHRCFCAKCQAAYAKEKDPANYANELIWGHVADLGNRLKKEGIRGMLTMMAYIPYRNVPEVELPDNVAVMLCTGGPWMRGKVHDQAMETMKRWTGKLKGKVWLWHNTGRYSAMVERSADVPSPTPRAFGRHYKEVAPWVFGAYCSNNSPRFLYSALNYYVFYKVAWDNATDVDALVDEYSRLMFGPAAEPMGRFLDLLERKWMDEVMGNVEDTPLGEMAIAPSEFRFWSKIYPLAFVKKLDALVKEAERRVAPDSIEARRVALFRREFLTPMFPRAEAYDGDSSVAREVARRAANPRPSVAGGAGEAVIEVKPEMTNSVNHSVGVPVKLVPGRRYRVSYFVRCRDLKLIHQWGGVGACVWSDAVSDRTLTVMGAGLCGTFDWIAQSAEFTVPTDIKPETFRPRLSLRVCRGIGRAEFKGLLVEEL